MTTSRITDGERIRVGALEVNFLVSGETTGGHADVFELTVPSKARVPVPHFHVDVDEVVIGLAGVLTYRVGTVVHELKPGDRVLSPRGVEHHFENRHDGDARCLNILTPGKFGAAYFRDVAEVLNVAGPPNMGKLRAIMERYGLVPAPAG